MQIVVAIREREKATWCPGLEAGERARQKDPPHLFRERWGELALRRKAFQLAVRERGIMSWFSRMANAGRVSSNARSWETNIIRGSSSKDIDDLPPLRINSMAWFSRMVNVHGKNTCQPV